MARTGAALLVSSIALVGLVATACATGSRTARGGGKLVVVAAESAWGSIAAQLGGADVDVVDLVDNPAIDPHDYEPTPANARAIATADYVIVNGLGYDPWASDLVDADGARDRTTLDVGDLLGLRAGDNPHRWYFPADVQRVIDRITADYQRLDPAHAGVYADAHARFTNVTLRPYRDLLDTIRRTYAGTPVGASESLVVGLFDATGLVLRTPPSFLDAIAEGRDPAAGDKVVVDDQLSRREVAVFAVNAQNATPDVERLVDAARAAGIPIVSVTESPTPAGTTFQDWQVAQLGALAAALAQATGRGAP